MLWFWFVQSLPQKISQRQEWDYFSHLILWAPSLSLCHSTKTSLWIFFLPENHLLFPFDSWGKFIFALHVTSFFRNLSSLSIFFQFLIDSLYWLFLNFFFFFFWKSSNELHFWCQWREVEDRSVFFRFLKVNHYSSYMWQRTLIFFFWFLCFRGLLSVVHFNSRIIEFLSSFSIGILWPWDNG